MKGKFYKCRLTGNFPLVYYLVERLGKGRPTPLQAMKAHGDMDASVHVGLFGAVAIVRGKVACPMLGRLSFRKSPRTHFLGG